MKIYEYDGLVYNDEAITDKMAEDFEIMLEKNTNLKDFLSVLPQDLYDTLKERFMNDESLYPHMGIEVRTVQNRSSNEMKTDSETYNSLLNSVRNIITKWEPLELGNCFVDYFCRIGYRKFDGRRKLNRNTYKMFMTSNGHGTINKVDCMLYGDSSELELEITFRKYCGEYIIIGKSSADRYIEVDSKDRIWSYEPDKLIPLIRGYANLFERLGVKVE